MAPVWISHRGLKTEAVENTLPAFRAAVAAGFGVLETDLRITADDHLVLHHDPTLARLAGRDDVVHTLDRRSLAGVELERGARLLFFDEFMSEFGDLAWVFDIKPEDGRRTIDRFVAWVKANGREAAVRERARFVLWSGAHQRHLVRQLPGVVCYAREAECWRAGLSVVVGMPILGSIKAGRTYALPPRLRHVELYTPEKVRAFHRQGARVLAFLPESQADIRSALASGVDEILTNGRIEVDGARV